MKANDLIFSANFYVFDMKNGDQNASILLGRSLLKTSKTMIDVHNGSLTIKFDGEIAKFNIYDSMKSSSNDNHVHSIDIFDPFEQEVLKLDEKDGLENNIIMHLGRENKELTLKSNL